MEKDQVRQKMRAKREKLTAGEVQDASAAVYGHVIEMPQIKKAKTVLAYADFDNEIQTGAITGWLLFEGKQVALPMIEDGEMSAVDYRGTLLKMGTFGVAQPVAGSTIIDPKTIDVVLCPGIAFSRHLDRLGFGKGFYDRFLASAPQALRIGLAYDWQVVSTFTPDEHDAQMNYVVTPKGVLDSK